MSESTTPKGKRIYNLHQLRNLLLSERIPAHVQPAGKDTFLTVLAENEYENGIEMLQTGELSLYIDVKPDGIWWRALRIIDQFLHAPSANPVDLSVGMRVQVFKEGSHYKMFGVIEKIDQNTPPNVWVRLHDPLLNRPVAIVLLPAEINIP